MKDKFKKQVLDTADFAISNLGGEMMFMVIKPIVNLARPELERMLEEKPDQVYEWLKKARDHINEALKHYENDE